MFALTQRSIISGTNSYKFKACGHGSADDLPVYACIQYVLTQSTLYVSDSTSLNDYLLLTFLTFSLGITLTLNIFFRVHLFSFLFCCCFGYIYSELLLVAHVPVPLLVLRRGGRLRVDCGGCRGCRGGDGHHGLTLVEALARI